MNLKDTQHNKKLFIFIGMPIYAFLFLFFLLYYIQVSFFFMLILGILGAGIMRKQRKYLRLTKIAGITFLIYTMMFYNILLLPSQVARRLPGQRKSLLEPQNDHITRLKADFLDWHEKTYNQSFTTLGENNREELELKLLRIDYYIRRVRMEYTYDTNAPYFYYDHLPTIDEIFESDSDGDGKLQDDCDGMTILTVSLLLNMGYDAWMVEAEYHYYTMVFMDGEDPGTEEGYAHGISLYNSKKRPAYMLFNDEKTLIPPSRPLYVTIGELFTGAIMYENYFYGFFHGKYFSIRFLGMIPISFILLLFISALIVLAMKAGNPLNKSFQKPFKKELLRISLINSMLLSFGLFLLYIISATGLGAFGNLILSITLISSFRFVDHQLMHFSG